MANTWRETEIKEKFQLINGTVLIASAIVLYFLAFILTMTIGFEIISAGATLLATGLSLFGITSFVKNQMLEFETKMTKRMNKMEKKKDEE
jgi:hypothetical protein